MSLLVLLTLPAIVCRIMHVSGWIPLGLFTICYFPAPLIWLTHFPSVSRHLRSVHTPAFKSDFPSPSSKTYLYLSHAFSSSRLVDKGSQKSYSFSGSVVMHQMVVPMPPGFLQKLSSSPASGYFPGEKVWAFGDWLFQLWQLRPLRVLVCKPRY